MMNDEDIQLNNISHNMDSSNQNEKDEFYLTQILHMLETEDPSFESNNSQDKSISENVKAKEEKKETIVRSISGKTANVAPLRATVAPIRNESIMTASTSNMNTVMNTTTSSKMPESGKSAIRRGANNSGIVSRNDSLKKDDHQTLEHNSYNSGQMSTVMPNLMIPSSLQPILCLMSSHQPMSAADQQHQQHQQHQQNQQHQLQQLQQQQHQQHQHPRPSQSPNAMQQYHHMQQQTQQHQFVMPANMMFSSHAPTPPPQQQQQLQLQSQVSSGVITTTAGGNEHMRLSMAGSGPQTATSLLPKLLPKPINVRQMYITAAPATATAVPGTMNSSGMQTMQQQQQHHNKRPPPKKNTTVRPRNNNGGGGGGGGRNPSNKTQQVKQLSAPQTMAKENVSTSANSSKDSLLMAWQIAEQGDDGVLDETEDASVASAVTGSSVGGGYECYIQQSPQQEWPVVPPPAPARFHVACAAVDNQCDESFLRRLEPVRCHRSCVRSTDPLLQARIIRPTICGRPVVTVTVPQLPLAIELLGSNRTTLPDVNQRVMQLLYHLNRQHPQSLPLPLFKYFLPGSLPELALQQQQHHQQHHDELSVYTEQDSMPEDELFCDISPAKRNPAQLARLDMLLERSCCQPVTGAAVATPVSGAASTCSPTAVTATSAAIDASQLEAESLTTTALLPVDSAPQAPPFQSEDLTLQHFLGSSGQSTSLWTKTKTASRNNKFGRWSHKYSKTLEVSTTTAASSCLNSSSVTGRQQQHQQITEARKKQTYKTITLDGIDFSKNSFRKTTSSEKFLRRMDTIKTDIRQRFVDVHEVVQERKRGRKRKLKENLEKDTVAGNWSIAKPVVATSIVQPSCTGMLKIRLRLEPRAPSMEPLALPVPAPSIHNVSEPSPQIVNEKPARKPPGRSPRALKSPKKPSVTINTKRRRSKKRTVLVPPSLPQLSAMSSPTGRRRLSPVLRPVPAVVVPTESALSQVLDQPSPKKIFCTRKEDRRSSALHLDLGKPTSQSQQSQQPHAKRTPPLTETKRGRGHRSTLLHTNSKITSCQPGPPLSAPSLPLPLSAATTPLPASAQPQLLASVKSTGAMKLRIKRTTDTAIVTPAPADSPLDCTSSVLPVRQQHVRTEVPASATTVTTTAPFEFTETAPPPVMVELAPPPPPPPVVPPAVGVSLAPATAAAATNISFSPAPSSSDSESGTAAHNEISSLLQRHDASHQVAYLVGSSPTVFIDRHKVDLIYVKNSSYKKSAAAAVAASVLHESNATSACIATENPAEVFLPGCFIENSSGSLAIGAHDKQHTSPSMPVLAPQEPPKYDYHMQQQSHQQHSESQSLQQHHHHQQQQSPICMSSSAGSTNKSSPYASSYLYPSSSTNNASYGTTSGNYLDSATQAANLSAASSAAVVAAAVVSSTPATAASASPGSSHHLNSGLPPTDYYYNSMNHQTSQVGDMSPSPYGSSYHQLGHQQAPKQQQPVASGKSGGASKRSIIHHGDHGSSGGSSSSKKRKEQQLQQQMPSAAAAALSAPFPLSMYAASAGSGGSSNLADQLYDMAANQYPGGQSAAVMDQYYQQAALNNLYSAAAATNNPWSSAMVEYCKLSQVGGSTGSSSLGVGSSLSGGHHSGSHHSMSVAAAANVAAAAAAAASSAATGNPLSLTASSDYANSYQYAMTQPYMYSGFGK